MCLVLVLPAGIYTLTSLRTMKSLQSPERNKGVDELFFIYVQTENKKEEEKAKKGRSTFGVVYGNYLFIQSVCSTEVLLVCNKN